MTWLVWVTLLVMGTLGEEVDPGAGAQYRAGVDAYLDESWDDCVKHMENAIEAHRKILTAITDCRLRCDREEFDLLENKNIQDLQFYEKMIKKTLCFMKCKRINYSDVHFEHSIDEEALKALDRLEPYNYLQLCYYQEKQYQKAASSAFTYLARYPNDTLAKQNLEYYLTLPEIDANEITNYEAEEYFGLYLNGINSYEAKDWENTVSYMEETLHSYIQSDETCRVLCEGSFDQGWFPDFTASVANHFTFCLKCKQGCPRKLRFLGGYEGEALIADIYNHLQFAYYKLGRLTEACQCVASYLLIYPADEDMQHNKILYTSRGALDMLFTPRSEIVYYLLRNRYEKKLLGFINEAFTEEMLLNEPPKDKGEISNEI